MHFGKFNILLLVLVFSFDFVRSDEDYDAAIDDNADEGVDDDAGVADDADGDLAAANDDAVADDDAVNDDAVADNDAVNDDAVADNDAVNDDAMINGPANGDIIEAETVDRFADPNPAHACVPGTHFKVDCNFCYCHKTSVQSCTFINCEHHRSKKLSSNPSKRLAFKKLREHATGCVPGETIKHENCECSCSIPSVLTCPENCLR